MTIYPIYRLNDWVKLEIVEVFVCRFWSNTKIAPLHPRTSWRYINDFTYLLTYIK